MFESLGGLWQNSWLQSLLGSGASNGGKGSFLSNLFDSKTLGPALVTMGTELFKDSPQEDYGKTEEGMRLESELMAERMKAELELKASLGVFDKPQQVPYGAQMENQRRIEGYQGLLNALTTGVNSGYQGGALVNSAYGNMLSALK